MRHVKKQKTIAEAGEDGGVGNRTSYQTREWGHSLQAGTGGNYEFRFRVVVYAALISREWMVETLGVTRFNSKGVRF